ncbi:MAG TPA: hypothetical protein DEF34_01250 [Desulfotomaculum sp.]|nr:hypothetical protein [Desulfotomaculum sp.]
MIKVIRIRRTDIALALLALAGIAFCVLGFGGLTERLANWRDKPAASATLGGDATQESDKPIGGGTPVDYTMQADPEPVENLTTSNNGGSAYFVEYRMERERARGMEMETMREVLASPNADEDVRKTAHERLLHLSNSISKEMELESLIRAKGFSDAAVFLDGQTVTVVVQEGNIPATEDDHIGIIEMVAQNTGVEGENIIIITRPGSS